MEKNACQDHCVSYSGAFVNCSVHMAIWRSFHDMSNPITQRITWYKVPYRVVFNFFLHDIPPNDKYQMTTLQSPMHSHPTAYPVIMQDQSAQMGPIWDQISNLGRYKTYYYTHLPKIRPKLHPTIKVSTHHSHGPLLSKAKISFLRQYDFNTSSDKETPQDEKATLQEIIAKMVNQLHNLLFAWAKKQFKVSICIIPF